MQCVTCGNDNDPGMRYCLACGRLLTGEPDDARAYAGDALLAPGTVLKSTYEIIRLLGEGGAGSVYEARHVDLGHAVAVKVLFGQLARIDQVRHRFLDEGRIQANLRHPNVVSVTDVVDDGSVVAMVMELVEGETLHEYIMRQLEPMPMKRAAQIVLKLLAGLGTAHERDIVHRDIKPGNVMLARTEHGLVPKLCDFGIAKVATAEARRTVTGTKMGTLHYMAPEQFQDAARVDRRADLYSLGVTFFEMLTRRLPFVSDNDYQLMRAHIELSPPDPRTLRPDLLPGVAGVVLKALEKSPDARFQTCDEMAQALVSVAELEELALLASMPGVPIADGLLPLSPRLARRATGRTTPPTRATGLGSSPFGVRPRSRLVGVDPARPPARLSGPLPELGPEPRRERPATPARQRPPTPAHERRPPTATRGPGVPSRPSSQRRAAGQAARPRARSLPWFPIFLGAFATLLIAVVAVWLATREPAGAASVLAGPDPRGPKPDDRYGAPPEPARAPDVSADPANAAPSDGEVVLGDTEPSSLQWNAAACEALAEEVADLEALHHLGAAAAAELTVHLDDADVACRELLLPRGEREIFMQSLGRTQQARLRIARAVLRARASGDDRITVCDEIALAHGFLGIVLDQLLEASTHPALHESLRETIHGLGQSVVSGRQVLERRYASCSL
jgi:eukaryotic-like serine/threonine-protein kinase